MYEKIFNQEKQDEMRSFFLNELVLLGKAKNLKRNEILNIKSSKSLAIVVEGMLEQVLYHFKGEEKVMFFYHQEKYAEKKSILLVEECQL